jgi:hypothetical protein
MKARTDRVFGLDLAFFMFFVALTAETRALGAYLFLLFAYLLFETQKRRWPRAVFMGKLGLIYFAAMATLLGLGVLNMTARYEYLFHDADPVESLAGKTHDGMMASEEAVRLFLAGENPYTADFSQTDIKWIPSPIDPEPNPANLHYIYQPAIFILPAPFKGLIERVFGYFDLRPFHFVVFALGMLVLPAFGADRLSRLGLAMALGLNFAFIAFTAEGRNDIVGFVLMLLAWLFLAVRRRVSLAAVLLGVACATKQSTWFMVPYFALYALGEDRSWDNIKRTALRLWPLPVVVAAFILPFFLRAPQAYVDDSFRYPSGALRDSYPIFGFSLARALVEVGVIEGIRAPWPAALLQALVCLPVLALLLWRQRKRNTMSVAWLGYALLLLTYGFLGRFLNNNLVSFTITCLLIAYWARPPRDVPQQSVGRALRPSPAEG